jgi:hypothetical protein
MKLGLPFGVYLAHELALRVDANARMSKLIHYRGLLTLKRSPKESLPTELGGLEGWRERREKGERKRKKVK